MSTLFWIILRQSRAGCVITLPITGQPRLYYSQVMWMDQVRTSDSGAIQYHVNERYGNPGDLFWADGAAFRPLTQEDVSPINPDVDPATKKMIVNLNYQTLSCMEGDKEVYFCRVSTGMQGDSTPVGEHAVYWKLISVRMTATATGASYDLPGMSWTTFFAQRWCCHPCGHLS